MTASLIPPRIPPRIPGVMYKVKAYRGYVIRISREGTWAEAAIYKNDRFVEHVASGTYGPSTHTAFFKRAVAIIDAMHGD
jgi:hypothetical protein